MSAPSLLILQPTPYCNLNCSYCYLPHRDLRSVMSEDVLRAIARYILAPMPKAQRPAVIWHAGEPMTVPPKWYHNAFELLRRESGGTPLNHGFQTNGVGVTDHWLKLWQDWNVQIGVSLDGPAEFHNRRRKTRRGTGSHALTMKGVETLKSAGYPFHIISVLTTDILPHPELLIEFYADNDLHDVAFNIEEIEGQTETSSFENDDTAVSRYRQFLKRFYELSDRLPVPINVRELQNVQSLAANMRKNGMRNTQNTPLAIVTIAVDGGMSTFSPELIGVTDHARDNFIFANVCDGGVERILLSPAFQQLKREVEEGKRACARSCGYFDVCGGGAPANKYFEHGRFDGTETLYCQLTIQANVDVALDFMEQRSGRVPEQPREMELR
ncbi:MAG: GRRM system radical SAM/SPASM domain protein [Roseibium sp.]|uniref:cyclophane-forming radical SAM/SPASM peptide maturase GrrM/OscB n=1 Tax=Roseibium sp. TaxID=1936156 RepID=UPI002606AD31|nr:cyclophane-forming radical SAM/SPASM peptide maturase GrrM/OscB [Roseibium sp.]MCV0424277.1 GRRM system radical SAM/SPASM domain protein [Roseibium sp.]